MKHGKDTIKQASDLISALYKADAIPVLSIDDRREFCDMVRIAKSLHRIAEHDCNGTKTARMETQERNSEARITQIASRFGLKAQFDGDPRGFVVKIHAPKGDVYNTWGGKESGYGIG